MRPLDCPGCYAAAERNGVLVVQLRKTASRLHFALGHAKHDWAHCQERPCVDNRHVMKGARLREDS